MIDTSKDIWESMKQKYQESLKVKRAQLQTLRSEFEALCMKDGETVNEYFSRTLAIANQMKAHGEKMPKTVVGEKIMRSMNPKFNYVSCSVEHVVNVETLSIDGLQCSILVEEGRMKHQKEEEQALKVTGLGRSGGRGRGRTSGRGRGRGEPQRSILNATSVTRWTIIKMNVLILMTKKQIMLALRRGGSASHGLH